MMQKKLFLKTSFLRKKMIKKYTFLKSAKIFFEKKKKHNKKHKIRSTLNENVYSNT